MLGSPPGSRLDPAGRTAALGTLDRRRFDVLVVGGGVTGAGIALDAVTRGLSVALVERDDFASGTSSRSSKLIHGGLRYVEQRNFALVREALHERRLLLTRIAPHLVRPVPFLLPVSSAWERWYFGAGVALYDGLSGREPELPRHRHLGRQTTLNEAPALRDDDIVGAIRYFDAQVYDARFVVTLVRTALAHGATAVAGAEVTGFLGDSTIEGVRLRDRESGSVLEARARVTVLAGGVATGALEELAGVRRAIRIRASKGVHLLVPRERIDLQDALILRAGRSVLLVVPWGDHWLIGTTDTPWGAGTAAPVASLEDVDYLLHHLNAAIRSPLGRDDVTGCFAGLRPLVDDGDRDTTSVSREHIVRTPKPGLVSVAGGKYTTYRVMAAAAVDAAAQQLATRVDASRTVDVPLVGAESVGAARSELASAGVDDVDRLVARYGSLAPEVVASSSAELAGAGPYTAAEIVYAATHEGARHLVDVLSRRTRISFELADGGRTVAPVAAELLALSLGWSSDRTRREVAAYESWLAAERSVTLDHDHQTTDVSWEHGPRQAQAAAGRARTYGADGADRQR